MSRRLDRRFYVAPGSLAGDAVALDKALAQRLAKVLRVRAGDEITLFDGSGVEARVRIDSLDARVATASVIERLDVPPEPRAIVHLYQSITKSDRFEWLIEKATEVGVASITPLITSRSVVRTPSEGNRAERWRRIAIEAAEQCGRSAVPDIGPPLRLDDALSDGYGLLLVPNESAGGDATTVDAVIGSAVKHWPMDVSLFIGPEGGFEDSEIEQAQLRATIVTLGPRVLRSETAGLVALTLVLQASGDLG